MNSKIGIAVLVLVVAMLGVGAAIYFTREAPTAITTFEQCAAAENPVMESYPRQCRTPDGEVFVEQIATATSTPQQVVGAGCAVAGCSRVICTEADKAADVVTTCEYRAEYACFGTARCEKQPNGSCGWTETSALTACLQSQAQVDVKG